MSRLFGALLISLLVSSASFAQTTERLCDGTVFNCPLLGWGNPFPVQVAPFNYTPLGGQYTPVSDSSAQSLSVPTGATYAVVCAEGANHRYTWDGVTTPTASVGQQLMQNACLVLTGAAMISNFKIIQQTSSGSFTVGYAW